MTNEKTMRLFKLKSCVSNVLTSAMCSDGYTSDLYDYNIGRIRRYITRAKLGHRIELLDLRKDLFVYVAKKQYKTGNGMEKSVANLMLEWFSRNINKNYDVPAYWGANNDVE